MVVGTVVVKRLGAKAPAQPAAVVVDAAPAAPVAVEEDVASVRVENGVVKFYFATAKAELAAGANEALADVVKGVAEGKKAVISGFHDATGDAACWNSTTALKLTRSSQPQPWPRRRSAASSRPSSTSAISMTRSPSQKVHTPPCGMPIWKR